MGKALYRTYRSKKLSEIVGQEHITTALERALKKGHISHAYLFTGPRGVGKTSIARILAYEVNGLPYDESRQNLDIIEIDAASNRRIDEIRDLREKVHTAPSGSKYKVYIIDEVHMLTKEAFNALLKTLEEPPAHVIFILATTEAYKLPATIISRTQRYTFKPIEQSKITAHLRHIADEEKIAITDEALELIAQHGDGSFRDSISLLDQARNSGNKVTLQDVQTLLGIAPHELIDSLLAAIVNGDSLATASCLGQLQQQGYEAAQVAKQVSAKLRRDLLAAQSDLEHAAAMRLLAALVQVPASRDPQVALEIAVLDAALAGRPVAPKTMPESIGTVPPTQIQKPPRKTPTSNTNQASRTTLLLNSESWALILNTLKKDHNTLYGVTKLAKPYFAPGELTLEFTYAFHQRRIQEARNKQVLSDVIENIAGSPLQIICTLDTSGTVPPLPVPGPNPVETISNIFGSAELLES